MVLKIPIVYLCAVVWWAIRAEPRPLEGAGRLASLEPHRAAGRDWRLAAPAAASRPAAAARRAAGRLAPPTRDGAGAVSAVPEPRREPR